MRNGSTNRRFTEPQSSGQTPRTKSEWRRRLVELLPADEAAASRAIVGHLAELIVPSAVVVLFWPMPGEPDLRDVATTTDATFGLTRTPPTGPLTVHPWSAPRETHRWGFEQPVAGATELELEKIDLVLVPGVGFGRDGSRLGHGRGYYDELLERMPSARRIGVTWDCRLVGTLPAEPHDVPMHEVVTEGGRLTVVGR